MGLHRGLHGFGGEVYEHGPREPESLIRSTASEPVGSPSHRPLTGPIDSDRNQYRGEPCIERGGRLLFPPANEVMKFNI